jgi:hypothetical protein
VSGYKTPIGDGAPLDGLYPTVAQSVLLWITTASGVAAPTDIAYNVIPLSPANTTVSLVGDNPDRTYLLIYNPTQVPAQISKGQAVAGAITNLAIGPGQAYFGATAQGLGDVYTGPLTAISQFGQLPLWVWEDKANLYNNGGYLAVLVPPAGYPTSPIGLPAGAVWNDGLTIGIVPGFVPNPAAPAQYFGRITAKSLLAMGGGNLPLANPGIGTGQLWNDGGVIAIA